MLVTKGYKEEKKITKVVIFLDVDGVLNIISDTYRSCNFDDLGLRDIERHLLRRLEYLIDNLILTYGIDVEIVKSSSWNISKMKAVLRELKFKYIDLIVDDLKPCREGNEPRGKTIRRYVEEHNIEDYIVIDDEEDIVFVKGIDYVPEEKFVKINSKLGLTDEDIFSIVNKLNLNKTELMYHRRFKTPLVTKEGMTFEWLQKKIAECTPEQDYINNWIPAKSRIYSVELKGMNANLTAESIKGNLFHKGREEVDITNGDNVIGKISDFEVVSGDREIEIYGQIESSLPMSLECSFAPRGYMRDGELIIQSFDIVPESVLKEKDKCKEHKTGRLVDFLK